MKGKKHSLVNWVLWIVVLLCLADLVYMTYRKIANGAPDTSKAEISAPKVEGMVQANLAFVEQKDVLTFEGKQNVDAKTIPWKTNCGIVEDTEKNLGTCLFLTPNTAVAFACSPESMQSLSFDALIYPAVQSASDGCSLRVQLFDADTQAQLTESTLQIPSSEQSQNFSVDLSEYAGKNIWVRLACGNGQNNNDDGDWLFLTSCSIE